MSREELLKLCHLYDGESKCPDEYSQEELAQLWQAERMLCEDILRDNQNVKMDNPQLVFETYVSLYVLKWNPYTGKEALDVYFELYPKYRKQIMGD